MARIKVRLKEMRNASVDYVSLVDRSASRMPIRIMKADKESGMLDLTNIRGFLSRAMKNDAPAQPVVSALVMLDPGEELGKMKEALTAEGFSIEAVTKAEDGSMVFAQDDQPMDGAQLVRLSEHLLLVVKGLDSPEHELGFVPDLPTAITGLRVQVADALGSESPAEGVKEAIKKFEAAVNVLAAMPQKAFKAEVAVAQVFKGKKAKKPDAETMDDEAKETPAQEAAEDKTEGKTEVDKGCAKKADEQPAPEVVAEVAAEPVAEPVVAEPVVAVKTDSEKTLEALAGLGQMVQVMASKLDSLGTDLAAVQARVATSEQALDAAVKKVDTATQAMSTTVLTPPPAEQLPAPSTRATKADDLRSRPLPAGFDSAFHLKSR